jgi:hypothetical protein
MVASPDAPTVIELDQTHARAIQDRDQRLVQSTPRQKLPAPFKDPGDYTP